jgi:Tape measure protein
MADLKYNVIISTDSAISSLEGFKKVIEGFNKTIKLDFDTQAIKSVSSTLQQITKDVTALNKTKINFDVSKLTVPKIDTNEITQQLNRIGQTRNLQIIPKISSFTFPAQKPIEVPVKPKFYSENLRPFGNAIVNGFLDIPGRISSIFSSTRLPSLQLPKIDFSGAFEGLQGISSSAGSSAGKNFGSTFTNAIGNIIQITIGNLLANAISTVTNTIASQGKQLIGESVNVEQSNAQLTVLLGTQEKAAKLIKELQVIARTTPYAFPELIETTKNLIAFGVPAEKAVDVTKRLGDIAFGDKTKLKSLGLLYGKIASQDFVSAGNINSATKFSISIEDIATNLGITSKELTKFKSSGRLSNEQIVSYEDFDEVITTLTSNMGRFNDASTKASKTLGGLLSNVPDIFGNILDDLLGVSQGVVKTGGVFNVLKDEVLSFNDAFLGTDFSQYTVSLGSLLETVLNTLKSGASNVQKYIKNIFGDININEIFNGIGKGVDTFGSILNQVDFTGITKFFASLFAGVDFSKTGNFLVDLVKGVQELSTAISETPEFKFISSVVASIIKTVADDLAIFVNSLKGIKDNDTAVGIITDIGTGITAIAVALGFLNAVAVLTKLLLAILNTDPIILTIIAIVGAITLVVIGVKYLLKELDKFNNSEAGKKLSKDFDNALKSIGDFFNWLGRQYAKAKAGYEAFWIGMQYAMYAQINKMIKGWNNFWNPINEIVGGDFSIKVLADYEPNPDLSNLLEGQTVKLTVQTEVIPLDNATIGVLNPNINPTQQIGGGLDGGTPSDFANTPDVSATTSALDQISAYFTSTWESISVTTSTFFTGVNKWFDEIPIKTSEALEFVKQWFITKYDEIKLFLESKFAEYQAFYDSLPQKAETALEQVKQWFLLKFEEAKIFVQQKIEEIKTFFEELPQKAIDVADSVRNNFSTGFTKVVSAITSKFKGIGATIESYFSNIKLPTLTLPPIRLPALPDIGKLLGGQANYTGTNNFRGGITEIAERGRELVRLPSGIMSIFNDRQFTALPKGTVIYNNQDTERMLNEGYLKGSNLQGGTNNNISSSSVQNTVINRPTNIYSTNYNGYQQSSYLNPLSS